MNKILEHINKHPKDTKRVIGITDKQLRKLIENAQIIAENQKAEAAKKKGIIKPGGGRKKCLKVDEEIILT